MESVCRAAVCRAVRVGKRRAALNVLLMMAAAFAAVGYAGGASAQDQSPTQLARQRQHAFSIPPQPLAGALASFGRQSGMQVSVDGDVARGISSPGVVGSMTAELALGRLLAGTGITYSLTSDNTAMLQRASAVVPGAMQLDPVQVQGSFPVPPQAMIDNIPPPYAGGQVATGGQLGLLGNRDVMDTPFNQTNYTVKKAQDQQAKTIKDVLIDDPSVRAFRADDVAGADGVRIRGFTAEGVTSFGGLYGLLPSFTIMAELAERVEVLKGPNVMLNGMPPGGIGGSINIVPKRAPSEPLTQLTANYVSAAQFGGHVDVARRFGEDKQFGVRFNGVFRAGQTDVQWNTDERALGVLGLDFRGERVRFSVDLGYQYRYVGGVTGYIGLANGVALPWAPNVRNNPVGQPWGYAENKDLFGMFRGELDLTDRITAYVAFGAHDFRNLGLSATYAFVTDVNGAAINNAQNISIYQTNRTAEAGVRASLETGPISHALAFTATSFEQESGIASVNGPDFPTSIYNPTIIAPPGLPAPAANKTGMQSLSSLGIADTLSAAEKRVQLTVGARLQRVAAGNFNATSGAQTSNYDQSVISPSVALVVKPFWENVSLYGNWIQGLQQGLTVTPPFANAGEVLPPFVSTQYEAGIKVDWGKFTTTASLFQITQPFVVANVAANTLTMAGEQRNQGLELNVFGEPTEGVRLLGGAMFLSPVLTKTAGGLTDGWVAPFSPTLQLNLSGEWDLPFAPGLTVNGRVIYTGAQYIDTTWPRRSLPEWTRFDLGARYAFDNPAARGKPLVARFNVENVLDANYWAGGSNAFVLALGAPRTFRLSLTADF